ncbi:ParB/RepB/Spo0J family partition protein [Wenzhouxiangella sp. AB-CW3]|uniref:ParB/RepB/Spo0J family partition protein n=1 Tax=Wenzhouxiangella sp. AB-CW3 TaxID=2771012 RepID=UPI00168B050B|nr:ParB/RepB/Spo0J family partition protein [Wenzhouxiangella sp. AB-CW3]QOC22677.1 ParB/RepB/Spo0J family partition protein [Wenzhouxiangella sp. AB-CW3]
MNASRKKKPLGRNLDALLGKTRAAAEKASPEGELTGLKELPLDVIEPGRYQPRSAMDPDRLQELSDSIREQGLVQPVVVRPLARKGRYELIAGERRWRACQMAGMETIPALVREVADEATLALALIENIQRENLNPLEEAAALKRLIEEFDLTHEQAATSVGRSRAAVTNLLRLLDMAPEVRELVDQRELDMGHARALLGLERNDQVRAAREVVEKALSVRQTEALVRRMREGGKDNKKKPAAKSADIQRLEQELTETLCAPVSLRHQSSGKGQLNIRYTSLDELDGIIERLRRRSG